MLVPLLLGSLCLERTGCANMRVEACVRLTLAITLTLTSLVPRPSNARALPLPLNYRNVEMKNALEGSGKKLCPEVS